MLPRSLAVLRAQALAAFSYPVELSLGALTIALTLAAFYFISHYAFGRGTGDGPSSREYFAFVAVGILISGFLSTWLSAFSRRVREFQISGALEMLLATRTPPAQILIGITLYDLMFGAFQLTVGTVAAVSLFGLQFQGVAWLPLFLSVFLGVIAYVGIGLVSAAFVLLYKRGNPVAFAVDKASILIGGVYFPVTVMPNALGDVADLTPLKHILDAVRLSASSHVGAGGSLLRELVILSGVAVVLLVGGMVVLNAAMRYVLSRGTVAHY